MVEHVIIPSIVKESIEVETLDSISSLTQTLIQYARPLVEGDASDDVDSSRHRVPAHFCRSCGSLCTYYPSSSENAGARAEFATQNIVMTESLLNETFGIDTQVNFITSSFHSFY